MGLREENLENRKISREDLIYCNVYIEESIRGADYEWCTTVENDELTLFNKILQEKLPYPSLSIREESEYEAFTTRVSELVSLPCDVLNELHQEQLFKEFGDSFMLLYVDLFDCINFIGNIKDKLFEYNLDGWCGDFFTRFLEENEELEEYEE